MSRLAMIKVDDCGDCPFIEWDNELDDNMCSILKNPVNNCDTPLWCPLPFVKD